MPNPLSQLLSVPLQARLTQFDGCTEIAHACHDLDTSPIATTFAGAAWEIACTLAPVAERPDALDGALTFRVTRGAAREVAVGLEWPVAPWAREHFVLLPAAAYNGNRYACRPYNYPPMVHATADIGPDAPILVTDVPRLSAVDGTPSRIQLLTGDVTTPCIAFHAPAAGYAAILLTEQGSAFGNHGLTVEESLDRSRAWLRVEAPGVRRDTLYTMATTATPSWDHGADWEAHTEVTIRFRLFIFPAHTVQDLYTRFAEVRTDLSGPVAPRHTLPFSAAWQIIEEKYARHHWNAAGYYQVAPHEVAQTSPYGDWQVGWVGGGMVPLPMLIAGTPASRAHALTNLEWMFTAAQHPNGLFHAIRFHGAAHGDGFGTPGTERWYMVRKQADALYYLIKTYDVLRAQDPSWQMPPHWEAGTRRLADLFVQVYRQYGQLGQYLDCATGALVVGGSTAAAIAPAALAAAGRFFQQPAYREMAVALAEQFAATDLRAGVTVGGPGEILKCPDSESAFALLESFVVLYEVTGSARWLAHAEAMAAQCLTWCATADYRFPPDSPFGRLDMRAAGSVWANVQNKHSAPGICTFSGDMLLKLFRYTGNTRYLAQIQETAHNITQYLSRADRLVGEPPHMQPGWMCERVNFSDWEGRENIGGSLFGSSGWCEVALMLTTVELPGIYLQPDTGLLRVFDHLDVTGTDHNGIIARLECHNPTAFDARVRVFADPAPRHPLPPAASLRWPIFDIPAGETRQISIP